MQGTPTNVGRSGGKQYFHDHLVHALQQSPQGRFCAFCLGFPPLEYILSIPPHSSYVIGMCFILFKKCEGLQQIMPYSASGFGLMQTSMIFLSILVMKQCCLQNEEVKSEYNPVEKNEDQEHENDPIETASFSATQH